MTPMLSTAPPPLRIPHGSRRSMHVSAELIGAFAQQHGKRRLKDNPQVHPQGPLPYIPDVHADRVIEGKGAPALDLPQSGNAWFHLHHPPSMPYIVILIFVRDGG